MVYGTELAGDTGTGAWTAADLVQRFGPIPLHRVRHNPAPGSATERDLLEIHHREDRLYELADGVLLEKTMGIYESYLAVEVISKWNTREEMERKLHDYFTAGVRLAWYVYPDTREVRVYDSPDQHVVLSEQQTLDGGEVLPGFSLDLQSFFAEPGQASES